MMLDPEKIDRLLPEDFKGLLTQSEYEIILDCAIQAISKHAQIQKVKEGEIETIDPSKEESKMTFNLRNVVRKCKTIPQEDWAEMIDKYLGKPLFNEAKHSFLMKDFEYAEPLLKVVVRSKLAFDKISLDRLAYREDIPHTCTFLVLDYDERFHYIDKTMLDDWELSLETLFQIALTNVGKEVITVEHVQIADVEVFVFFSGDFAVSYLIELSRNAPEAIGAFGAILHIPTKGKALVHPLNGMTVMHYLMGVMRLVEMFFTQDQGPINMRTYWYYEGEFFDFPMRETEDGAQQIHLPEKLQKLLASSREQ